jgi:hypothetical protein
MKKQSLVRITLPGVTAPSVLAALVAISAVTFVASAAVGQDAQASSRSGRAVCEHVAESSIFVQVPQSDKWKGRAVAFTASVVIQSDGRIDVSFSNPHNPSKELPLKWLWKNVRVSPTVSDLIVKQKATPAGDVSATYVSFRVNVRLEGDALLVDEKELVPEYSGNVYGPAVKATADTRFIVAFRDNLWPLLNSVNKEQFRVGKMTGASFEGYDVQGGDFPNRSFIRSSEGMVRVKRADGNWVKVEDNMDLDVGDMVKTLSNGKVELVLAGTAMLRIKPDSEFIIPTDKSNTKEKVSFIEMVRGVLWARARKDKDSLKVATPNAICGVRGTDFEIDIIEEGKSCFYCHEGEIAIRPQPEPKDAARRVIVLKAGQPRVCVFGDRTEPAKPRLPVTVRVFKETRGQKLPLTGAKVTLRQEGKPAEIDQDTSDSQGFARLTVGSEGSYQIEATAEHYVPEKITAARITAGKPARYDILLKRRPDAPPEEPAVTPTAKCSFEGLWMVHYYNNKTGTGEPPDGQRMKIVVSGNKATGYSPDLWTDKMEEYCSGPLSQDGQVWNAKRIVGGAVSQYFADVHFDPDCNRFVGKWGGEAQHDYAWVGIRMIEVKPPAPPAPSKVTVELSSSNRNPTVKVAPGSTLTVKVATYAGTGYQMEMVPLATRDLTVVSGPVDEAMQRPTGKKGKIGVGAGTWKVYELKVAAQARGEYQVKFQFFRTKGKPDIEYVLTIRALGPL